MGADDDADCVEHVRGMAELHLTPGQSGAGYVCTRCGAVSYDDLTPPANRPKL